MSKIKFIGESDENFTNGNIYELVSLQVVWDWYHVWFSNSKGKLVYIPYSNIDTFNDNWEFVREE